MGRVCTAAHDRVQRSPSVLIIAVVVTKTRTDFRLFLTVDPSLGEVSRAMRNRCVEVAVGWDETAHAAAAGDEDNEDGEAVEGEIGARVAVGGPLTLAVARTLRCVWNGLSISLAPSSSWCQHLTLFVSFVSKHTHTATLLSPWRLPWSRRTCR